MVKADAKSLLSAIASMSLDASEREVRRLFWRDDMEDYNVCRWTPNWPAGGEVGYVNTPISAFEGDHVLRANHPTEGVYDIMSPRFGCFKPQKTAFEMRWWYDVYTRTGGHVAQFWLPPTGLGYLAGIRWYNGRWQYEHDYGNFQDIPGGSEALVPDSWNYLKVIVDWENRRFYRLISTFLDLDLTAVLPDPALPLFAAAPGQFYILLGFQKTVANRPSYIDDVRIYLNEV
jgi:hypothetical protein